MRYILTYPGGSLSSTAIVFLACIMCSVSWAAEEDLDEMTARISRQPSAEWGPQYLENSENDYIWQPETLSYTDILTGGEVWRLSSTPGYYSVLSDISFPSWSADGKRFAFRGSRNTAAWISHGNETQYGVWMVMKGDGTHLRPQPNAPARTGAHAGHLHWSPVLPDVYYQFGRNAAQEGLNDHDLYKVTVSDVAESRSLLISFPSDKGELGMKKAISGDGTRIMATDYLYESWWFPATVYPEEDAGLDVPGGYPSNRPSYDDYWLDTAGRRTSGYNQYHDQFLCGAGDNIWFYIMPESAWGSWWRIRLTGSESDGGPRHIPDHTQPYEWGGEMEPLTSYHSISDPPTVFSRPYCEDGPTTDGAPDCTGYWSHVAFDRWGKKAGFSAAEGPYPYGVGTIDIDTREWHVATFNDGAQHHDWHAWSDWIASSDSSEYPLQKIMTEKYNDPDSSTILCSAHIAPEGNYNRLARPTQSPDGTKTNWHSTFLNNNDDNSDLFYVVAYYPYPPEVTGVAAADGIVTVRVDWRLNTPSPRGYTARGWPDEATDIPPAPREVAELRLWRSHDGSSWFPAATVVHDIFSRFDFIDGGFIPGQDDFWEMTDTPGDGTWYYAVTSREHSGLESRTLSNVFRISLSGGSGSGSESGAYPAEPGGISAFYTKAPPLVTGFSYDAQSTPGQYRLGWDEPQSDLIRYYNVYTSSVQNPPSDQRYRIASLPVGTHTYLDWLADPGTQNYYGMTSVDSQGNESAIVYPEGQGGAEPPRGDLNGDLVVNVQDLQACVNLILSGNYDEAANMNGDSVVDALDAQEIANIILGGG